MNFINLIMQFLYEEFNFFFKYSYSLFFINPVLIYSITKNKKHFYIFLMLKVNIKEKNIFITFIIGM